MEREHKIIKELRRDARQSIMEIARKTNIPKSTVFNRLNDLTAVTRYTALLDYSKLGFHHRAKTIVKCKPSVVMEEFLKDHDNVNSLYQINSGYTYLIETLHENIKQYQEFIDELKIMFDIETKDLQVIETIKEHGFFSAPIGNLSENSTQNK